MTNDNPQDNTASEREIGHLTNGELVTMEDGWVNIYRRDGVEEIMSLTSARHNAKVLETAATLAELYLYERRGRIGDDAFLAHITRTRRGRGVRSTIAYRRPHSLSLLTPRMGITRMVRDARICTPG